MSLSEFEIINRFFSSKSLTQGRSILLGPGDDCAIISPEPNQDICVSTDTLISGVHFPEGCSASVVAHRSLGVNLSDLAAMGSTPLGFTLAMTLPQVDEKWLAEFSMALESMVKKYQCPLIGGNLAKGSLSLTLQVMGTVPSGQALQRSGAREGDQIYVSGTLGDAACGLGIIADSLEINEFLEARYYYPEPRVELGIKLRGIANSAIDISDGLISDLGHICKRSNKGAEIEISKIPLSRDLIEKMGKEEAIKLALSGGDDYELCFTVSESRRGEIEDSFDVTPIGKIVGGNALIVRATDGSMMELDKLGYDHFG